MATKWVPTVGDFLCPGKIVLKADELGITISRGRRALATSEWPGENVRLCELVEELDTTADKPKPDWSSASAWATWAIINQTFSLRWCSYNWMFLENKPELRHNMWRFDGRWEHSSSVDIPLGIDHRTLKERRPE